MSNINTGGPAFPVDRQTAHGIAIHEVGTKNEAAYIEAVARLSHGMTLRDYFAAKAIQGLLANQGPYGEDRPKPYKEDVMNVDEISQYAYVMADAMLKARES